MTISDTTRRLNTYLAGGCAVTAILSITLGVVALVVWYSQGMPALPGLDGSPAMEPNTALGFILCGIAIWAIQRGHRGGACLAGSAAGLLGLSAFVENAFGFNLAINEWLVALGTDRGVSEPVGMAPSTGLCFFLGGTAFVIAANLNPFRARAPFMGLLGSVVFGIGVVTAAGYLLDTYPSGDFVGMGPATAMGFIVVGISVVALGWIAGAANPAHSQRWLPVVVGASGVAATIVLWQAFLVSEQNKIEHLVRNEAINVHNQITSNINSIMFELLRVATRWERFDLQDRERMGDETAALLQWLRGMRAVGWLDLNGRFHWIFPQGENSLLLASDLASDPRHKAAAATAQVEGMALTEAGDSTPASDQYFTYTPISDKRRARGFLVGIFNAQELLDNIIDDEAHIGYSIALYDGGREIYRRRGSDPRHAARAQKSLLSFGRVTWQASVWPKPSVMAAMKSNANLVALLMGILGTALLVAVTYFAQTAADRARQIETSNEELQREIAERKRVHQQIQLQLERISVLQEINLAVTSTLDQSSLLTVLVETIQRLLPYSALLVWLKDYKSGELKRAACWNLDEKDWMERNISGIPELVRVAMDKRRAVVVPDIQRDPRTLDREFYRRNGLISYLGLPLVSKDETLGVLVFLTREAHEFDDEEVRFLGSVTSQAAVAIQNSQLYEKIHGQAKELENANKLQADFTAMIAHDLRSPLSNISGIAEMMHQGLFGQVSEEQKNWLQRMRNNCKNLVQLVSDFLDISKVESGRIELQRSETDVYELASSIVVNYQPVAASRNIALTCVGDPSPFPMDVDPRRLDQVITNLLSNALKFTRAGGSVELRVEPDRDTGVKIEVKDSGVGIPSNEIPNLFQKYRQADSTRLLAHHGTGLGLVICKMIVEAHGGKIWVKSKEGQGTSFYFTLPAAPATHEGSPADASRLAAAEALGPR